MTKSIQRQIDEHLGLGGPKPKIPTQWLASEMEEIAEREREHDANNVFLLEEAAARLVHLEDALVFVRPALAVLRNMCRTAGLKAGEAKAEEINQYLRAVLTAEDSRDPEALRGRMPMP